MVLVLVDIMTIGTIIGEHANGNIIIASSLPNLLTKWGTYYNIYYIFS